MYFKGVNMKNTKIVPRDRTMILVAKREISLRTRVRSKGSKFSRKIKHKNQEWF